MLELCSQALISPAQLEPGLLGVADSRVKSPLLGQVKDPSPNDPPYNALGGALDLLPTV